MIDAPPEYAGATNATETWPLLAVATTVDITINEQTEGLLDLVITDNGSGLSKDATPGIGSDLFDSLAYSWSRDSSGSSTTITAVLTWTPAL